ncbi:MAG: hypothetical protein HFJ98_00565 [Eubacterium sp.]|nr:hypothetical protein [Eubacterium sp.]
MTRAIDLGLVNGQLIVTDNDIEEITQNANDNIVSEVKAELDAVHGYEGYSDIVGLQVDYENNICTRLAAAKGLEAGEDFDKFSIYGGMKRCNVSDNGTITAYYGDNNYADNGSNGQVMVYIPKFYYKIVPLKINKIIEREGYHTYKANYFITDTLKPGFKVHPAFINEDGKEVECFLYSAYEGSLNTYYNSKYIDFDDGLYYEDFTLQVNKSNIQSLPNKKPISGQQISFSRNRGETIARRRGEGWHIETIQAVSALQILMMLEYGTMNMQLSLGNGITTLSKVMDTHSQNLSAITGSTNNLGNNSGEATTTRFSQGVQSEDKAISYRGIENPYGNLFKYVQGINSENIDSSTVSVYISDDFNFEENKTNENYKPIKFQLNTSNKITSYFQYIGYDPQHDWLFLPSQHGEGKSNSVIGDGFGTTSIDAFHSYRFGGCYYSNLGSGIFCGDISDYDYATSTGCRLIYLPQN